MACYMPTLRDSSVYGGGGKDAITGIDGTSGLVNRWYIITKYVSFKNVVAYTAYLAY